MRDPTAVQRKTGGSSEFYSTFKKTQKSKLWCIYRGASVSIQMVDIDMGAGQKCSGASGSSSDPPRKLGRLWLAFGLGLGLQVYEYG